MFFGSFEDTAKFNLEPMESFEKIYQCVFVTVCDNPSKCLLNTLQFVHVETGQIPEERVAVIKASTHQGISCQDISLISQLLSNPPEIRNLNETCLANIADMAQQRKNSIKPDTNVLYNNCWLQEITK